MTNQWTQCTQGATIQGTSGEGRPAARSRAPSYATMERWMSEGIAKATDGCRVEPDGTCLHGCHSWLIELGLI